MRILGERRKYTASHGKLRIRQHEFLIEFPMAAKTCAFRAGSVRIVEGEHARRDFRQADAAVHTGKILAEHQKFPVHYLNIDDAFSQLERRFQGIRQTLLHALPHEKPVNDHLDGMLLVLFQLDLLIHIIHFTVNPGPYIALLADMLQKFLVLAFLAPYDLCHDKKLRALRQLHDPIDHLVHGLLGDRLSAFRTMGTPCPCEHEPQIIIDFRNRPHRGTRIVARGFLVDGNGRGQTLNIVHIGLVHLPEKLPRIRRQRFHIPPLSFRIDGVKGQRGLPRPGKPRDDHQLVPWDLHINVFQIMGTCALDLYRVFHNTP